MLTGRVRAGRVRDRSEGVDKRDSRVRHPLVLTLGASSVVVLVAAACGGGSSSTATKSTSSSTQAPAQTGQPGSPTQVLASLTDYHIALSPQNLPAGAYTFVATNNGKVIHSLEIDGPGVEEQKTAVIQPGQSANLSVNLQNGTYDVYCPVDGHKGLGMNLTMTVGGSSSGSTGGYRSAGTTPSTSSGGGSGGGY